jgi:hypothetical protein
MRKRINYDRAEMLALRRTKSALKKINTSLVQLVELGFSIELLTNDNQIKVQVMVTAGTM